VKESGLRYNKELLNPINNQPKYTTNFKQAVNLGIYGADLAYLNIYEQNQEMRTYLPCIKKLAAELGINSSFEDQLIKRVSENVSNQDSIIFIVTDMFRRADSYLLNNERNDIALLVLAGGWLESLYLLTQSNQATNEKIISRIAEQKNTLTNLIELLRPYYKHQSSDYNLFLEGLIELAVIFDGVTIDYQYVKPVVYPDKKLSVIKSKSKTLISEYQLSNINQRITALRKIIVD